MSKNTINSHAYQILNTDANLEVIGVRLNNIGDSTILGGANGQVLTTDGTGNLSWTTPTGGGNATVPNIVIDGNILPVANSNWYFVDSTQNYNRIDWQIVDGNLQAVLAHSNSIVSDVGVTAPNLYVIDNSFQNTTSFTHTGGIAQNIVYDLPNTAPTGNGQVISADPPDANGITHLSWADNGVGPNAYSNANVANYLPTYAGNMTFSNATLSVTGGSNGQVLVTDGAGNLSWANGGAGNGSYSNANVANYLPVYGGNALFDTITSPVRRLNGGVNIDLGQVRNLYGVAYNGTAFVAIGSDSQAVISTDGAATWQPVNLPVTRDFYSLAANPTGTFVAVSFNSDTALVSTNGTTWTSYTLPSNTEWFRVVWGQDKFVALSGYGDIAYSTDGTSWSSATLPDANPVYQGLAYGNGVYVAVGGTPTTRGATSTDGINWSNISLPSSQDWFSVAYGNDLFVATTGPAASTNIIATSSDGITWTQRTLPVSGFWQTVAYSSLGFILAGRNNSRTLSSVDGITWTDYPIPQQQDWYGSAYGADVLVLVAVASRTLLTNPIELTLDVRDAVRAEYFVGNGSLLTGITVTSTYGNSNVANYLPTYGGNILANVITSNTGFLWQRSNLTLFGNGSAIIGGYNSGLELRGGSTGDPSGRLLLSNMANANITAIPNGTGVFKVGSDAFTANIVANYYTGNGANFANISNVKIGGGSNGNIIVNVGNNTLAWSAVPEPVANSVIGATGEPTGFPDPNRTATSIGFNDVTREFTIQSTGANFDLWVRGTKYTKTADTLTLPNTTGLYYISYNTAGMLQANTTYFDFANVAPVSYVYWNATAGQSYFFADERHGTTMDWQTHEYLHRTRGAVVAAPVGFGISGSFGGSGTAAANAQIGLTSGTFFDEDIQIDIAASALPAYIPVMYRVNNYWVRDSASEFPYRLATDTAGYNLNTAGVWSVADLGANKIGVMYVVATNDVNQPYISVMGQAIYDNIGQAEDATWGDLDLTDLPVFELRVLYKLIFSTNSNYTNAVRVRQETYQDLRAQTVLPIVVAGIPTLDEVLSAGNTTAQSITVGNVTANVVVANVSNSTTLNTTTANLGLVENLILRSNVSGTISNAAPGSAIQWNGQQWQFQQVLNYKTGCRLATVSDLGPVIYNNGIAGVGAYLQNADVFQTLTIDGVTVNNGDRIIVKDQTTSSQNGVYTVTNAGSGGAAWRLTRATDYDTATEVLGRDVFYVTAGATNSNIFFIQITPATVVGLTSLTFEPAGLATLQSVSASAETNQPAVYTSTIGATTANSGAFVIGNANSTVTSTSIGLGDVRTGNGFYGPGSGLLNTQHSQAQAITGPGWNEITNVRTPLGPGLIYQIPLDGDWTGTFSIGDTVSFVTAGNLQRTLTAVIYEAPLNRTQLQIDPSGPEVDAATVQGQPIFRLGTINNQIGNANLITYGTGFMSTWDEANAHLSLSIASDSFNNSNSITYTTANNITTFNVVDAYIANIAEQEIANTVGMGGDPGTTLASVLPASTTEMTYSSSFNNSTLTLFGTYTAGQQTFWAGLTSIAFVLGARTETLTVLNTSGSSGSQLIMQVTMTQAQADWIFDNHLALGFDGFTQGPPNWVITEPSVIPASIFSVAPTPFVFTVAAAEAVDELIEAALPVLLPVYDGDLSANNATFTNDASANRVLLNRGGNTSNYSDEWLLLGSNTASGVVNVGFNSANSSSTGIRFSREGVARYYVGVNSSSAAGNLVLISPAGTALTITENSGIYLGDTGFDSPVFVANAPSGTRTQTAGTAGQILTSAGAAATPYWKNGIYIAQNMTVAVQSLSVTQNTPINHTAPANLPTGWTYEAYTPVSGTNYWRNQTGRDYLVTVSGKVQVTVSGSPSNSEIDVWVSDVGLGNRPWQLACTGISSAQNIYAGPNNAAYHNINATLFVPNNSGFALWMWRNGGTLNVGGTPLGGFGTSSFLTVTLQEI